MNSKHNKLETAIVAGREKPIQETILNDQKLNTKAAANHIFHSPSTLAKWRSYQKRGRKPFTDLKPQKSGNKVYYLLSVLNAFLLDKQKP